MQGRRGSSSRAPAEGGSLGASRSNLCILCHKECSEREERACLSCTSTTWHPKTCHVMCLDIYKKKHNISHSKPEGYSCPYGKGNAEACTGTVADIHFLHPEEKEPKRRAVLVPPVVPQPAAQATFKPPKPRLTAANALGAAKAPPKPRASAPLNARSSQAASGHGLAALLSRPAQHPAATTGNVWLERGATPLRAAACSSAGALPRQTTGRDGAPPSRLPARGPPRGPGPSPARAPPPATAPVGGFFLPGAYLTAPEDIASEEAALQAAIIASQASAALYEQETLLRHQRVLACNGSNAPASTSTPEAGPSSCSTVPDVKATLTAPGPVPVVAPVPVTSAQLHSGPKAFKQQHQTAVHVDQGNVFVGVSGGAGALLPDVPSSARCATPQLESSTEPAMAAQDSASDGGVAKEELSRSTESLLAILLGCSSS